jgi:tetratricopeptide (TPR) repeat protein
VPWAVAVAFTLASRAGSTQSAPTSDAAAPVASADASAPSTSELGVPQGPDVPSLGGATRGDRNTRAIAHYERGRAHYAAGRYRAAIVELEAAIALAPALTDLQYDLGLVYERLGRLDAAIAAYRRYQASTTDPAERERTGRILSRLSGAQSEPLEFVWGGGRMGRADALFWSLVALSGASLVGASVTLALGVHDSHRAGELERMSSPMASAVRAAATVEIAVSAALFAATVGLATGAGLSYATRQAGTPPALNGVCLTLSPQHVGVALRF